MRKKEGENFMEKIPENIIKIMDKFIEGVNEILGNRVKRIILYGSYARRRLQQKF